MNNNNQILNRTSSFYLSGSSSIFSASMSIFDSRLEFLIEVRRPPSVVESNSLLRFSPVLNFSAYTAICLRAFTLTRVCSALWNSFSRLKLINSLKLLIYLGFLSSLFWYCLTEGMFPCYICSLGDTQDISLGFDTYGRNAVLLGKANYEEGSPAAFSAVWLLSYFGDLIRSKLGASKVVPSSDSSIILLRVTF